MPPIVIVPERCELDVFMLREYCTVPEPVPELPDVIVIQLALETAVQVQVDADAVTVTFPVCA